MGKASTRTNEVQKGRKIRSIKWTVLTVVPLLTFVLVYAYFSIFPFPPNAFFEASAANPLGLFISNFVFDGIKNLAYIVIACSFLLMTFLYFPLAYRIVLAFSLPILAIASSGIAEGVAMVLPWCSAGCIFYGMSGVASGAVGCTGLAFLMAGVFCFYGRTGRITKKYAVPLKGTNVSELILLGLVFVCYVSSLVLLSGVLTLSTVSPVPNSTHPLPIPIPQPSAIVTSQAPPVATVHSTSLFLGVLLSLSIFFFVNWHYRFFAPAKFNNAH